jgi:hypothetical protein
VEEWGSGGVGEWGSGGVKEWGGMRERGRRMLKKHTILVQNT